MGEIVPYTRRHKVEPAHRQQVELSPAEAVVARASVDFNGAMRITVVALMSGPVPELEIVRQALARLTASHPFLRCVIREGQSLVPGVLVAEVDDNLVIPVNIEHMKDMTLEYAWRAVYAKREKVCR